MTNSSPWFAHLRSIPKSIWALGIVSLFMDVSSELVHSLLPVFMVTTLGATATMVGAVEGVAEASALITRIFSGTLSDYLGKRKVLALWGYGLAAITKPLFPLADSMSTVLTARFIDRIGKGIRGAPRDALIGDIAPPEIRGASFGLRQSLDTIGAVIGPVLAVVFMILLAGDIRAVLWISVIPAVISVIILALGVKEPDKIRDRNGKSLRIGDIRYVGNSYWHIVAIAGMLTLARFSEAFLVLKAQEVGLPLTLVPVVMIVMSLAYTCSAYPAGKLSDGVLGRRRVLLFGMSFLVAADIVLGLSANLWMLALGVTLWGVHMGFTQGLLAAMVTDTSPSELRGTAYGVFNLVSGIAMLLASLIAGMLWDSYGSSATFFVGAGFTCIAFIALLLLKRSTNVESLVS